MQCQAKSKQSGEQCKRHAVPGRNVCAIHGGKSLSGVESPTFKTGRWAKHAPTKLLEIIEDTQGDETLLSVRDDIGLLDALIALKLQRLLDKDGNPAGGENIDTWKEVKKQIKEARKAYKNSDYGRLEDSLDTMEDMANGLILYFQTEIEIKDDLERRRKLVETEQRINLQGERAISADTVMLLMAQVLDVIKTVVTDDRQRFAIATGLQRLIAVPESAE